MTRTSQQFTNWLAAFADAVENHPTEAQWRKILEELGRVKDAKSATESKERADSGGSTPPFGLIPRTYPLYHWDRRVGPGLYNDDTSQEQLCCNTNRTQDVSDLFGMPRGFVFGIIEDDDDEEDQDEAPFGFGRYH